MSRLFFEMRRQNDEVANAIVRASVLVDEKRLREQMDCDESWRVTNMRVAVYGAVISKVKRVSEMIIINQLPRPKGP